MIDDIEQAKEHAQRRLPATLRRLKAYRELTDRRLADLMGSTQPKVNGHLTGRQRTNERDLAAFALALNVEEHVLLFEPDEALRWVLDNRPNPDLPEGPILTSARRLQELLDHQGRYSTGHLRPLWRAA